MTTCGKLKGGLGLLTAYSRRHPTIYTPMRIAALAKVSTTKQLCYRKFSCTTTCNVIHKSPFPDIHIKEESISEYLLPKFERFGNRTALVDGISGKSYTYVEMYDAVIKVASGLYRLGYRKGDVICMCSSNSTEFALLILACVTSGIVLTTTNPTYTSAELARHLCDSGAIGMVVMATLLPQVKEALASDNSLKTMIRNIIVVGEAEGYRSFSDLLNDDGSCFPENLTINPKEDVALLPYSSGTTGFPKGVMLTHLNIVSNLQQIRKMRNGPVRADLVESLYKTFYNFIWITCGGPPVCCSVRAQLPLTADDTNMCLLPMFHVAGLLVILFGTLQDGGKIVILPQFEPESFLTTIQQHKVTLLYMVPPIALFLARHPIVDKFDISSARLHVCAAAPLGEFLCKEYENRMKKPILQGYGMTELSPFATLDTKPPHHFGTVGLLVPNSRAKIVCPETGGTLGPGETGEICIQGPHVMKGYLNNEEATRDTIREGWLHTGDLGLVRDDGCFIIADRLKELIKYKGLQVAPAELEDLLLRHPGVQDAAVVGVPDERAGEIPRAYIVPKPNSKVTPEDVSRFVEERVAPFKTLTGGVEFLKEIPKSPSGKILRRILRDLS